MKSKLYFIPVANEDSRAMIAQKLETLLDKSKVLDFVHKDWRVAVKLHFGETGNTGFVPPEYVRAVCQRLTRKGAYPFLSDTNTLYTGKRTNSIDHLSLAYEHGFRPEAVDAEVVIPDDSKAENVAEVAVNGAYAKTAKIAKVFWDAHAIVDVAHFKGHIMTGFGGALKNLGMGCATRSGKLFQHSDVAPFVIERKCTGCKSCIAVCPAQAITLVRDKAVIDPKKCIGCASCLAACKFFAIDMNWEQGGDVIQEKMVEYAKAVLTNKKGKTACINFCIKITQECDCLAKDDPRIVPDIGIVAGTDPVAINKACCDLVLKAAGKDIFKELHPKRDGNKQLAYAATLGLGSLEYELISV